MNSKFVVLVGFFFFVLVAVVVIYFIDGRVEFVLKEEEGRVEENAFVGIKFPSINYSSCVKDLKGYPCCVGGPHNCCGDLWNENIRFEYMDEKLVGGIFIDIGANTGLDSRKLIDMYRPTIVHLVEPMKSFAAELTKKFAGVNVHEFAIANHNGVSTIDDKGWASTVGKGNIQVTLRDIKDVYKLLNMDQPVSLLNVNCEGCEYDLFEGLIELDLIKNFAVIQFGTHVIAGLAETIPRYCRIREFLSISHSLDPTSKYWAWERWTLRVPLNPLRF